jgi:hypothetical protein
MDPSSKTRMANFKGENVFEGENFESIYIGASLSNSTMSLNSYIWDTWNYPLYHERLKQSYYIVKDLFFEYD